MNRAYDICRFPTYAQNGPHTPETSNPIFPGSLTRAWEMTRAQQRSRMVWSIFLAWTTASWIWAGAAPLLGYEPRATRHEPLKKPDVIRHAARILLPHMTCRVSRNFEKTWIDSGSIMDRRSS